MNNPIHQVVDDLVDYQNSAFVLIAGPCVVESESLVMETAEIISTICRKLQIPLVYKSSYRKANRSSKDSFSGIGDRKALEILAAAGKAFQIPVITDIHSAPEAAVAAEFVDMLQIPAFLCRQTELLLAAGESGKPVSIKKGQFLSPESMAFAVDKVRSTGNDRIVLTERGNTFGYQDLVVDFRGIPAMQKMGVPVVLDVTHSLQQPNQPGGITGGRPELIETMARAGIAAGVDGIFLETHPKPLEALSDGANMLPMAHLEQLLIKLLRIRETIAAL